MKRRLRYLGAAVGFLTVGFAVGHEYARRSVLKTQAELIEREVSVVRDIYFEKLKADKEESDEVDVEEEVVVEEGERSNPAMSSQSVVSSYKDYSKFAEARKAEEERQARLKEPGEDLPDADDSEVYEDFDDSDEDYDTGTYHPDNISDDSDYVTQEPFQLSVDEFMEPLKRYEEVSLQYFREDKIVVDTSMVPVPNPEEFVGEFLKVFDEHKEGDTDVIFIRNNRLSTDIELIVEDEESFSEATTRWRNQRAMSKARRAERNE